MSPALDKGIAAAKAGNKKEALIFLREALLLDAKNANAWLWMAAMVDDPEKQRHCLKMVLEIEPDNKAAQNGLNELNQKFSSQASPEPAASQLAEPQTETPAETPGDMPAETETPDPAQNPSQPLSAASAVPSQPQATSESLSADLKSAGATLSSRLAASTPVSSKPIPASTPVPSKPVSPFTTPEITPDDPALIKTQVILADGVRAVPQVSKPAFLPDEDDNSIADQVVSAESQRLNTTLASKRKVERAARDRRWQIIILILLALIIIATLVIIAVFVYPKIMNSNLTSVIPQVAGLATTKVPDLISGITQPKQTTMPLPPQLGVFLVESGNYLTLTPSTGRPPNFDVPTTTNKLPVVVFYDPSIDPGHINLYAVTGGITGSEVVINLEQNQGITTSTVQTALDDGFYCFVQSNSTIKTSQQKWWCFNEGLTNAAVDTSINIAPPGNGLYLIQNSMPVALTVSSEVIASAEAKLPTISPSRPIVIANLPGVTPDNLKLYALVGGFGIQLSPTDASVIKIYAGSPAESMGIEVGDIILSVDSQDTNKDFSTTERLIEAPFGSLAKLYIQRGTRQVTLTLTRSWVVDKTNLAFTVDPKPGYFYIVPVTDLSAGAYCYESLKGSWCFGVQKLS
ncbi:MAG: PDZ domain-containing protein [Anaerolineaceae bacterium]|nr:PDZ domain-containing protein [Anaerolineaceae bacterium]